MIVFPYDRLGRVEGGNCIVEGSHVADVCPQPASRARSTTSLNWARSGTTTKSIVSPFAGRALVGDGHERSSGTNQARTPLRDVAAEDIENQIDLADIFQVDFVRVRNVAIRFRPDC